MVDGCLEPGSDHREEVWVDWVVEQFAAAGERGLWVVVRMMWVTFRLVFGTRPPSQWAL